MLTIILIVLKHIFKNGDKLIQIVQDIRDDIKKEEVAGDDEPKPNVLSESMKTGTEVKL